MNGQRTRIVAEARRWIGTPYVHQASSLGAGADCLGLLRGVWRAVLGAEPVVVPSYSPDWSEAAGREDLMAAAVRWLCATGDDASPGDVLLFRMRDGAVAKHLGIQSEVGPQARFVHAYRMRQHTELWQTLHAPQDPEPAARRRRARQEVPTN